MTDELVGREDEMARLEAFMERAIAAGHERSTSVLTSRPAETERRLFLVPPGASVGGFVGETLLG